MSTLTINEDYRITSDSRQWIFQKRGAIDKNDVQQWRSLRYGTLENIVKDAYQYFLRESEADSVTALLLDGKRILSNLATALTPVAIITER